MALKEQSISLKEFFEVFFLSSTLILDNYTQCPEVPGRAKRVTPETLPMTSFLRHEKKKSANYLVSIIFFFTFVAQTCESRCVPKFM